MPSFEFTSPEGKVYTVEGPEGATKDQAFQMLQKQLGAPAEQPSAPPKPEGSSAKPGFGERMNAAIKDVPRQLGLTARYGLEGMADFAGIAANPLAGSINAATGSNLLRTRDATSNLLDKIGLPKPETPRERVVGDASRTLAGGGGIVKGAQVVSGTAIPVIRPLVQKLAGAKSAPLVKPIVSAARQSVAPLAARPVLQAASAVGSGSAGGYVRETGGDETSQMIAAVAGGLAMPGAVAGGQGLARKASNFVQSFRPVPANIKIQINNAIEQAGFKPGNLPKPVMAQLERDVAASLQKGNLSPDAVRRLVDYRLVGATPGRGNLTLNPVDLTNQHNLSKIGANSSNPKLQGLAMRQNENTGTLIRNLNELGANTADDAYAGGQRVMRGLENTQQRATGRINEAYAAARAQTGIDAQIDPAAFTQRAGNLLNENLLEGALPADVRNILNKAATGELPLTVRTAEQIKTAIGNLQRSTTDGGTRRALGLVRQALDDAPLLPGKQVNPGNMPAVPGTVPPSVMTQGDDAINAFNQARGLNRNWRTLVERTPALQAIEDGVQPDRFVQDYIIRGAGKANVMDVARLKNAIKGSPDAIQAVREQILSHLKSKALSGKPDEAMTFTQSGYNNAFSAIGERKLRMFFKPEEIDRMKAVGRVAMYEQIQPSGSAVNNSNSGALAVAKVFDFLANSKFVNAIPFGEAALGKPAQNIATSIQGGAVTNVPNALLAAPAKQPRFMPGNLLLAPGASTPDRRN